MIKKRCFGEGKKFYEKYHDEEWGVPSHDDRHLFELLCLEGAQAGLSWETVLRKRESYKKLFKNFEPKSVVKMTDAQLDDILENPEIIRNKLKVYSVRKNARAFINIQKEFGSFAKYIWGFVDGTPINNRAERIEDVPAKTELSDTISKDLQKRGLSFVGSTIVYAYMQAIGLVNDHLTSCPTRFIKQ